MPKRKARWPEIDKPKELILRRKDRGQHVTAIVPNGDSYVLSLKNLRAWLKHLDMDELVSEQMLDQLWNFKAIHIDVVNQVSEIIPVQAVDEVYGLSATSRLYMPAIGSGGSDPGVNSW